LSSKGTNFFRIIAKKSKKNCNFAPKRILLNKNSNETENNCGACDAGIMCRCHGKKESGGARDMA
jgi:hypothetical protein